MNRPFLKYTVLFYACFSFIASPVTLAVTDTDPGQQIGADTTDPNLGGGKIGNGMGTSTGDSYIDSDGSGCPNTRLISEKLISATCWSCLFPIYTLGIYLGASSGEAPSGHYSMPVCICKDSNGLPYLGFTYGLWQPSKAAEFVRIPGCAATLNDIELGFSTLDEGEWNNLGEIGTGEGQFLGMNAGFEAGFRGRVSRAKITVLDKEKLKITFDTIEPLISHGRYTSFL